MIKNNNGKSFVTIMIVIAVLALGLRVTIEKLVKINLQQNESYASSTLKSISVALENYSKDHLGVFPDTFSVLVKGDPSYLDEDYITNSPIKGYEYSCSRLESMGYSCTASPLNCRVNGGIIYTVSTGGLIQADECSKKD